MGKLKVLALLVVLPIVFAGVYLTFQEYLSSTYAIDSYSEAVQHFVTEPEFREKSCTANTIDWCFSLENIVNEAAKKWPHPQQQLFYRHQLKAFREYRVGDQNKASENWLRAAELVRRPGKHISPAGDESFLWLSSEKGVSTKGSFNEVSLEKLAFDIGQLKHLLENGIAVPFDIEAELLLYKDVQKRMKAMLAHTSIGKKGSGSGLIDFNDLSTHGDEKERVGFPRIVNTFQRVAHMAHVPRLDGPAVNPALDQKDIELEYFSNHPGFTFLDDFLVPEALAGLQRLCWDSTFWFHVRSGYLGAYMDAGLHSPLLHQVAVELRTKFPRIFRGERLSNVWAYNYDSNRAEGINVHADGAYVNVNFWITPNEANMDPSNGGLVVYLKGLPMDWSREAIQRDAKGMIEFAESNKSSMHKVPYRMNRMVFFNSNLVHYTDKFRFRKGHKNRRINITMLFGSREDDEAHRPPEDLADDVTANIARKKASAA